jgi:hypothetical protein
MLLWFKGVVSPANRQWTIPNINNTKTELLLCSIVLLGDSDVNTCSQVLGSQTGHKKGVFPPGPKLGEDVQKWTNSLFSACGTSGRVLMPPKTRPEVPHAENKELVHFRTSS